MRTSVKFVFKRVHRVRQTLCVTMLITREPEHDSLVAIVFVKVLLAVMHVISDIGILIVAADQHFEILVVRNLAVRPSRTSSMELSVH